MTDAEPDEDDEAMRAYVGRLWAEEWSEDAEYDDDPIVAVVPKCRRILRGRVIRRVR